MGPKVEIRIPHLFKPRDYQENAFYAVKRGIKRIVSVFHRRSGKDKTFLNLMVCEAFRVVGNYYYLFPTYNQGRKAIWEGIDTRNNMKFINHIPNELRNRTRDTDMFIEVKNMIQPNKPGSTIQIIGSDKIDVIMGTNPIGCVYSEYAIQTPKAWDFMRPILAENNGWAAFPYTPRGYNHGWDLYDKNKNNPAWLVELKTVLDTGFPLERIQAERDAGMDEDLIQQEFYCSFIASVVGAYYKIEIGLMRQQDRICKVTPEPDVPVRTFWDLGIDDSTSIWLTQDVGREVRNIGYYENTGQDLIHYVNWLKDWRDARKLTFAGHVLPHDGRNRSLLIGKTPQEFLEDLGLGTVETVKRPTKKEMGIQAVRAFLGRNWFDEEECKQGVDCLTHYRKEWNVINKVFAVRPVHDWSSHGALAMQTSALWHEGQPKELAEETGIKDMYEGVSDYRENREGDWMG